MGEVAASPKGIPEPIPFIYVDEAAGKFVVNPDVENILRGFNAPIAVVAVVGLYRTGKSFLLNKLIGRGAFEVGPTVKPCTKGIWLWGEPVKIGDTTVIFMDTEGTGSTAKDSTYDSRVFSLAILLASHLIYNSVGSIDETSINELSLVTSLTKHIHVRASMEGDEDDGSAFANYFPSFLWVLRDFSLQLKTDGRPITPKQYLEESLQTQSGFSEAVMAKNRIRSMISHFFQNRHCLTLVRPILDEGQLQNVQQIPEEQLRPEFRSDLKQLREYLFSNLRQKSINGQPCSGAMFVGLARSYVDSINNGKVPTIMNAWDNVVEVECRKAVEESVKTYHNAMKQFAQTEPLPVENDTLQKWHKEAKSKAFEFFQKSAVGENVEVFRDDLRVKLGKERASFAEGNAAASNDAAVKMLKTLFQPICIKAQQGEFPAFSDLNTAFRGAEEQYLKSAKGPSVMSKFVELLRGPRQDAFDRVFTQNVTKWEAAKTTWEKEKASLEQVLEKTTLEKQRDVELLNQKLSAKTEALEEAEKREKHLRDQIKEDRANAENEMKQAQATFAKERAEFKEEIAVLRKKEDELEAKLGQAQHSLVTAQGECDRLKSLAEQTAQFSKKQEEEWKSKEEGYKAAIEEAKNQGKIALEEAKGRMKDLKQEMEKALAEATERANKAEVATAEARAATEQERSLSSTKIDFLTRSADEAQTRERQLRDKLTEVNEQSAAELQKQREKASARQEELQQTITELKARLTEADHAVSAAKSTSELQTQMLQERISSMQQRLDRAEDREKELQNERKQARKEFKNELKELRKDLEGKAAAAEERATTAEAKAKELESVLADLNERMKKETTAHQEQLEQVAKESATERAALQQQIDHLEEELRNAEDLKRNLDEVSSRISSLENEKDNLEKAASELVDELATERLTHEQELMKIRDLGPTTAPAGRSFFGGMFRQEQAEWAEKQKRLVGVANKLAETVSEQQLKIGELQSEKKMHVKKLAEYWRRIQELERKSFRLEQELRQGRGGVGGGGGGGGGGKGEASSAAATTPSNAESDSVKANGDNDDADDSDED